MHCKHHTLHAVRKVLRKMRESMKNGKIEVNQIEVHIIRKTTLMAFPLALFSSHKVQSQAGLRDTGSIY